MRKELTSLREKMQEYNIDAYLIPTTDYHGSEYVNDFFKCREYVSGFTGSAGTLLVTMKEAKLWTDGRYFLQAATQLKDSGIDLMKMDEPGVPTIDEYLDSVLTEKSCLGFDGKVIDCKMGTTLGKKFRLVTDRDLVGEIWEDRPELTGGKIFPLKDTITGETVTSKLERLRAAMSDKGADYHLITKLEEIAWLFNMRGEDVDNTPVFYAFALIDKDDAKLYLLREKLHGIGALPYHRIFEDLTNLPKGKILINEDIVSLALVEAIPECVEIINDKNPIEMLKAVKNRTEIECTKEAHIKDGVAMVNFLYWLKNNVGKIHMTELSAADYLERMRREQNGCFDLSFVTISGYCENGAIIHYEATKETDKTLSPEGFLLVDSGGQYMEGTTDITRTIVLGPVTEEMKLHYTTVLRSNIILATTEFSPEMTGGELDKLTREPLNAIGLDYNHGTGHGVGHILSVHEEPNRIRKGEKSHFCPGMITSDEPGVYLEGKYGIRLENELLCVDRTEGNGAADTNCSTEGNGAADANGKTKYGFETITLCPFDREAILPELMTDEELKYLNDYHKWVYETLSPRLDDNVREWLKTATEKI